MELNIEKLSNMNWQILLLSIVLSIILSIVAARIALRKELSFIKEKRLRDRYWTYLKALVSKTDLELQTYNLILFAKNPEIGCIAKKFLRHSKNDDEVAKLINLMREDLNLPKYKND